MTPLDRIKARLSPAQVSKLADMLDEVCSESSGAAFTARFRARGKHIVGVKFMPEEEIGWPRSDGQTELPLNGKA